MCHKGCSNFEGCWKNVGRWRRSSNSILSPHQVIHNAYNPPQHNPPYWLQSKHISNHIFFPLSPPLTHIFDRNHINTNTIMKTSTPRWSQYNTPIQRYVKKITTVPSLWQIWQNVASGRSPIHHKIITKIISTGPHNSVTTMRNTSIAISTTEPKQDCDIHHPGDPQPLWPTATTNPITTTFVVSSPISPAGPWQCPIVHPVEFRHLLSHLPTPNSTTATPADVVVESHATPIAIQPFFHLLGVLHNAATCTLVNN